MSHFRNAYEQCAYFYTLDKCEEEEYLEANMSYMFVTRAKQNKDNIDSDTHKDAKDNVLKMWQRKVNGDDAFQKGLDARHADLEALKLTKGVTTAPSDELDSNKAQPGTPAASESEEQQKKQCEEQDVVAA